jgi:hypothetical protein
MKKLIALARSVPAAVAAGCRGFSICRQVPACKISWGIAWGRHG